MEKLDGMTLNVINENIQKLKELFPEAFKENKVDFDMLKAFLGDFVEKEKERYEFNWNGKSEAIRMALKQSSATLRPCKEESKNWDATENLYLEGDNLEVLRVLQDSYRGKIKMIYIDPPYNTGNDLIYKDNFSDNIKNYKNKTQQSSIANPETNGRFHSDWCSMIYPRLRIAKNLLTEDGVIFISIDDKEVHNLRKICDEIFGSDNFITNFIWVNSNSSKNDNKDLNECDFRINGANSGKFKSGHEYILAYAKLGKNFNFRLKEKEYKDRILIRELTKNGNNKSEFTIPKNTKIYSSQLSGIWSKEVGGEKEKIELKGDLKIKDGVILEDVTLKGAFAERNKWIKSFLSGDEVFDTKGQRIIGIDFNSSGNFKVVKESKGEIITNIISNIGSVQNENRRFEKMGMGVCFSFPKPVDLLKTIINFHEDNNFTVLDFFSGSSTTAHAVMQLNTEDSGNRKFIMVQLPENLDKNLEKASSKEEKNIIQNAIKLCNNNGYNHTICSVAKERIRLVGKEIKEENKYKENIEKLDIGFKVFKLDDTNLKQWDEKTKDLSKTLLDITDPLKTGRTQEDLMYEVLLKYGVDISLPIEEKNILGKKVFSIAENYLLMCLEKDLSLELIEEMAKLKPSRIVFYDEGFKDNNIKINAEQILNKYNIEDIRVI